VVTRERSEPTPEGAALSMSRRGSCHDNAPVESFLGTLKNELHLQGDPFETHEGARRAVFEYIEIFYNRQRRHSTIGNLTPGGYEERYLQKLTNEPGLDSVSWKAREDHSQQLRVFPHISGVVFSIYLSTGQTVTNSCVVWSRDVLHFFAQAVASLQINL
jgi:putative transposase